MRGSGNPLLALEYAGAVAALSEQAGDANEFICRWHALAARDALDAGLVAVASSRPELVDELRRWALLMSWRAGDYVDLARRLPDAEAALQLHAVELSGARELARWVEGFTATFRQR